MRAHYNRHEVPKNVLMRGHSDIEQWVEFGMWSTTEELQTQVAHSAGKGCDGPRAVTGARGQHLFPTGEELFDWIHRQ